MLVTKDTKWVAEFFMPTASEYGCKTIFFIIDKANSLKEELDGQINDSAGIIEFKFVFSLDEIE